MLGFDVAHRRLGLLVASASALGADGVSKSLDSYQTTQANSHEDSAWINKAIRRHEDYETVRAHSADLSHLASHSYIIHRGGITQSCPLQDSIPWEKIPQSAIPQDGAQGDYHSLNKKIQLLVDMSSQHPATT